MTNPLDQIKPLTGASSEATKIEQARAVAEVAAAIQVAQTFPRNLDAVKANMVMLCASFAVAQEAFYAVPNRGSGMSVHLARELVRLYGNVDYGVRELSRTSGQSEMQAWAWDQETNTRTTRSFIQPHQRSIKGGRVQELTDMNDIYLSNQNTGAKAVRECIFAVLPGWLKADAGKLLEETLKRGEGKPLAERITDAVAAFGGRSVTAAQLERHVGKKSATWSEDDVAQLLRVWQSITRDGISVAEFFPDEPVQLPAAEVVPDAGHAA